MSIHTEAIETIEREIEKRECDFKCYRLNTEDYEKRYYDSLEKRKQMEDDINCLKETLVLLKATGE